MAYVDITTRTSADTNSSADINQLNDNIVYLKNISTPITLNIGGTLSTSATAFKTTNGFTYEYYGSELTITDIRAVQGTADKGGTQGTVDVKIGGTTAQSSAVSLSASDDTHVQATLTGTADNLKIESGNSIEIDYVEGTNADAENLAVFIYCKVT